MADVREFTPEYTGGKGFINIRFFTSSYEIFDGKVAITNDNTSQRQRNNIIRGELIQALGFLDTSPKYNNSIFNDNISSVINYSDLDKDIVRILYLEDVKPLMDRKQVSDVLKDYVDPAL